LRNKKKSILRRKKNTRKKKNFPFGEEEEEVNEIEQASEGEKNIPEKFNDTLCITHVVIYYLLYYSSSCV